MKAHIDKIIDKVFKKGYFWKTMLMIISILTAICVIFAIMGYFKMVDINVNIKKQERKQ